MITIADCAREARPSIARALNRGNPPKATLDEIEDIFVATLVAREKATRRDCTDHEPAFFSRNNSEE